MAIYLSNFFQDAYPATDEFQCIKVIIPNGDAYKWLLAGLIYLAGQESSYVDPESEQTQGVAELWRTAYLDTDWSNCVPIEQTSNQSQVTFWHALDFIESGAALTPVNNTAQITGYYYVQGLGAVGDDRSQRVWLAQGDYQIDVFYVRLSNNCKLSVIVQLQADMSQFVPINQVDIHGATLFNQKVNGTFTLTESGEYKVYWLNQGVPSGGGNNMPLSVSIIRKVAN